MPSWAGMTPTVETVLLISMAVGGFWCIFVCLCQIVRRVTKTARKNTVYRRDSSRRSSRHGGPGEPHPNTTPLHHGATQLQESHPLQPLFVSSRGPLPPPDRSSHRAALHRNPSVDVPSVNARRARLSTPTDEAGQHPDYVERVVLPGFGGERMMDSPGEDYGGVNEEPPPYDDIDEHMDFPAPPAYNDLFPHKP